MPVHLATDPAYRGRGIFGELEAANEERGAARGRGSCSVPNAASASVLLGRLGWTPLPSLRVWARRRLRRGRPPARAVARFDRYRPPTRAGATGCCATRPG